MIKRRRELEFLKYEVKKKIADFFGNIGIDFTFEMSRDLDGILDDDGEMRSTLRMLKDKGMRERMVWLAKGFLDGSIKNGEPIDSDDIRDWKPRFVDGRLAIPVDDPLESIESLVTTIWNTGLEELPPGWIWYLEELQANRMTIDGLLDLEPSKPEASDQIYKQPDFLEMQWEIITGNGGFKYEFFSFVDFVHYIREIIEEQDAFNNKIRLQLSSELTALGILPEGTMDGGDPDTKR